MLCIQSCNFIPKYVVVKPNESTEKRILDFPGIASDEGESVGKQSWLTFLLNGEGVVYIPIDGSFCQGFTTLIELPASKAFVGCGVVKGLLIRPTDPLKP